MPHHIPTLRIVLLGLGVSLAGCAASADDDGGTCVGAKCDIPDGPDDEMCELRRADAFDPNQLAFTPDFLRWSCSDVAGVTAEDRGQEYCEYFAVVELPPTTLGGEAPPPAVVSRNLGPDYTFGTTASRVELSFDQLRALEDDDGAVIGQCVFTSWNADVPGPVPACLAGSCPTVAGLGFNDDDFRMHFDVNSYEAAEILVNDCASNAPADGEADDFTRGCMLNAEINDTAFRKSDSFVCAATMRVGECGCGLASGGDLAKAIAGPERRGFPLGTWSSPGALPLGCRYLDIGDASQTIVTCDLTAGDVINYALDLKSHCQSKYGGNVVVHVPMPAASAMTCAPEASGSAYAGSCSATPWVVEP